jgi:hypothetical protein
MTPVKNATLTFLLSAICMTAGAADDPMATSATFTALYARFNAAMNVRNTGEVGAMLAPGFHGEDIAGKPRSSKKLLEEISELPDDANRKVDSSVVSLTLEGATAQVVQRLLVTTTKSLLGKKLAFELVALSDDTWTQTGSGWQLLKSTTRRMEYSANGSVISQKTNPPK